jgi:hypothetical protein
MNVSRHLVALATAALLVACASPGLRDATTDPSSATGASGTMSMQSMEPRMAAMRDMHQKMVNAKSDAERQALMADHMKAMQGGMAMLKERQGMQGMSSWGDGKGAQGDADRRQRMMAEHMAMVQMMMDMMMDRMPPAAPAQ